MSKTYTNPETIGLHAGWRKDDSTNSVAVPIHQTSSFQFDDCDHAANLFALSELGNIYSRIMNPTCAVLEDRIAALEGGVGALAVASGQAASAYAIQNIARKGDNIVASSHLYGGTYNQFKNPMSDMGIEVRFVDPADPNNFAEATDENTRAYYGEVLPNPSFEVFPISEVAEIGRPLGIPLIVDNTAAPVICKPFDHGAAVLIHSTTKFIGGHGTSIGGIIVDSGNFDWEAFQDRQPALNSPDPSYGGAVWTEAVKPLGPIAYILKARTTILRDMGAAMSPFNAFMFIQGLETLALRMREHSANAEVIAKYLSEHDSVERVIYPSAMDGYAKERAEKYLTRGNGGLMGFEIKGGRESGEKFINALEMVYHVANIGDSRSLAIHPGSTTHSQLSEEELLSAGITPGFVRLSIGLEHTDDIIADFEQALSKI
ncbi:MAG: bifunctional O-acetylhomoserine aminocarboxypropyltransferase/cysteine synthase [SAR86 cluster bacterium]|jgi:O-acetylhomoserine (thiol)-lyase|uniref:Bifunctional O-acetylhomoserine aminocarboxypropyltransferase/cysteine synthase n=1 Tax=SAR86 cluster bacterium TaxID=2030880 RepID=A0A520N2W3_9GAMM|nr:MAG: bifunctional O-acetylhomoserine aminocarboxypropyltransferase/cysteine synthase [SAR86 cluster bacterium]|tara:strand:+ start:14493 stop:15785 length:1293 start_codon:yes stop_codon:yes gene_type:complete